MRTRKRLPHLGRRQHAGKANYGMRADKTRFRFPVSSVSPKSSGCVLHSEIETQISDADLEALGETSSATPNSSTTASTISGSESISASRPAKRDVFF